jgi:hypothetical protein
MAGGEGAGEREAELGDLLEQLPVAVFKRIGHRPSEA